MNLNQGQTQTPPTWVAVATEKELKRILRAARTYLDMQISSISQFTDFRRVFRFVDAEEGNDVIKVGAFDPAEDSYCHWIAEGLLPKIITNTAEYPVTASLAVTKALGIGAYIGTPIKLRDGTVYGTFCCFSPNPEPTLTKRDLAVLEAFAEVAGQTIQNIVDSNQFRQNVNDLLNSLTPREKSVLESLGDGASNKTVALRLSLSPRTVEMYRRRIFEKLGVENLPQALLLQWKSQAPLDGVINLEMMECA